MEEEVVAAMAVPVVATAIQTVLPTGKFSAPR
jgi:hypothetical protein